MDWGVIVTIAVPVASGLAFLSYRHRRFYNIVFAFFIGAALLIMLGVIVVEGALQAGKLRVHNALPADQFELLGKIDGALDAVKPVDQGVMLAAVLIGLFMWFLSVIPTHADVDAPTKPNDQPPTEPT